MSNPPVNLRPPVGPIPNDVPLISADSYMALAGLSLGITILCILGLVLIMTQLEDQLAPKIVIGFFTGFFGIITIGSFAKYLQWR